MTTTKINGLALTAAPAFVYRGGILFSQTIFPFLIVQFAAVGKVFSSATNHVITYEQSVLLLASAGGQK
ncbi:MAG: hypothetical protein AB4372_37640 [Xenococcus sp. (in: cyanobacteria)]